jgi:DNA-binding NarL/FixJ family response regulator
MIRVFVADDHEVMREGLKRVIARADEMLVVGEAASGDEVLRQIDHAKWDVLLLDLSMPGRSGLDVVVTVKALRPSARIVVLTMHAEDQYAVRILRAGADGYLTKGRSAQEVLAAIRAVAAGGKYITPELGELLLSAGARGEVPHASLTDRELEVLVALGHGATPSAVAARLGVSASTVSTHIRAIKRKLALESLGELIQYAIRSGLAD